MGFFNPSYKWIFNPEISEGYRNIEKWGRNLGRGIDLKTSKGIIKQMASGDYGKLAGTLLSPIKDMYATQGRELGRNMAMGGNAFAGGAQPGLMAGIEGDVRRQMAEGEGRAYGEAIPQLYGQATNTFRNAKNSRNQMQLGALEAGLRGRMGAGQLVQNPSMFSNIMGIGQLASAFI